MARGKWEPLSYTLVQRDEKRKKSRGRKLGQLREEKRKMKEKESRTHQQRLQFDAVSPMRGMLCLPDGGIICLIAAGSCYWRGFLKELEGCAMQLQIHGVFS